MELQGSLLSTPKEDDYSNMKGSDLTEQNTATWENVVGRWKGSIYWLSFIPTYYIKNTQKLQAEAIISSFWDFRGDLLHCKYQSRCVTENKFSRLGDMLNQPPCEKCNLPTGVSLLRQACRLSKTALYRWHDGWKCGDTWPGSLWVRNTQVRLHARRHILFVKKWITIAIWWKFPLWTCYWNLSEVKMQL